MKSTFKENFDKYELLLTPFFLLLVFLIIIIYMPQLVPVNNFDQLFLFPMLIGCCSGIIVMYILDKYWKKVSFNNISDFLKTPTLVLIILSSISTLIVTINVFFSLSIIGFGLGNMLSLISITSIIVYYRTFLNNMKS